MERAWLLEDLKPWSVARNALGLVLSLPGENPLKWYDGLHKRKVLKLLEKALKEKEDLEEVLETYFPRVNYPVPAKPKARDLLDTQRLKRTLGSQSHLPLPFEFFFC
jgi:hypothetical protein